MTRWVRAALLVLGLVILAGFVRSVDLAAIVLAVTGADAGRLALAVLLFIPQGAVQSRPPENKVRELGRRSRDLPAAGTAVSCAGPAPALVPGPPAGLA